MGGLECAGCSMIAFGPPFALFVFTIAKDPLRVILFVAGAFFYLLALLLSAFFWWAVEPLREHLAFGLFFSVFFQEGFRYLYFVVVKKAEAGLQKVSDTGMHIDGVHSLRNAKHTIAYVCGLGIGTMSGAFALVNILADSVGDGTPGFVASFDSDFASKYHGDYLFFLTSTLYGAAIILLNVAWTVVFWDACFTKKYVSIAAVIGSHLVVSGLSLLNTRHGYAISIPICYLILIGTCVWASMVGGCTRENVRNVFKNNCQSNGLPPLRPLVDDNGSEVGTLPNPAVIVTTPSTGSSELRHRPATVPQSRISGSASAPLAQNSGNAQQLSRSPTVGV